MKLKSIVAAVGLSLASAASFASGFSFDGTRNMIFSFNIDQPSSLSAAVTSSVVDGYGFDITSVTFDGTPFAGFSFGALPNTGDYFTFSSGLVSAGLHSIAVTGTELGSSYHANVVVTPVPEPESYALMLAGLGVMGFIAARRTKG